MSALTNAEDIFLNSGMSCQNYDSTLYGWSLSSTTPNNINISSASPLVYSHPQAVIARNSLITNKGWTISGDTYDNNCLSVLSTSEMITKNPVNIYPNPATDFIYIKNMQDLKTYTIFDASGRTVLQNSLHEDKINISSLIKGSYLLKIITKEKNYNFKFIKK
ncbi:T9SS type A sorting domain-containing protein [Chryseobacterium arachidis]|uniref:T9SS type A sorting domain-containing protein n=1 Tax=Chryseobacterium arachidis TaxID=1416778 RepID=UPI0036101CD5